MSFHSDNFVRPASVNFGIFVLVKYPASIAALMFSGVITEGSYPRLLFRFSMACNKSYSEGGGGGSDGSRIAISRAIVPAASRFGADANEAAKGGGGVETEAPCPVARSGEPVGSGAPLAAAVAVEAFGVMYSTGVAVVGS